MVFVMSQRQDSVAELKGILQLFSHNRKTIESVSRDYYSTVRNYGTEWLDFGKKYDTEFRTEFLEKVRYGNTVLYFPYRTVSVLQ